MTTKSDMVSVGFYVEAYMKQDMIIVGDISKEELINGLNEGKYFTTIDTPKDGDFINEVVEFDDNGNEVKIAIIQSQSVEGDSRVHTFKELPYIEE